MCHLFLTNLLSCRNMFSVRSETSSNDFSIKNSVLEATFSGDSGLLKVRGTTFSLTG